MNERIFIAAGGVGSRLLTSELPKCMLQIPIYQSTETEMVLKRTLRLLNTDIPITFLTGYGEEQVKETFPGYDYFRTLNVDKPGGILTAIDKVLRNYKQDSYIFILSDVIWSKEALEHAINTRHKKPITLYHDFRKAFSETYMITIHGNGISIVNGIFSSLTIPSLAFEKQGTEHYPPRSQTPMREARIGHLDQLLRDQYKDYQTVIHQIAAVEDIDTDGQYENLSLCVKLGVFDEPAKGKEWLNLKNKEVKDE